MILGRIISGTSLPDLAIAFDRLGLPGAAREYLLEKLPSYQVLLTGLRREEGRFLKGLAERESLLGREEFPSYVPGDQTSRPGTALLLGRVEQLRRVIDEARELPELQRALTAAVASTEPLPDTLLGDTRFHFGNRTYVMGVINVTPDSFSDGGQFLDPDVAIEQGLKLAEAGADLLDIGGESTRPGSSGVSAEEQKARVLPVLKGLRARVKVPLSIDTTHSEVANAALGEGATLVNDISGFTFDPRMPAVVARAKAACCLMHVLGTPLTMQKDPQYEDVVAEVVEFLGAATSRAQQAGLTRDRIWVDPGIGFGKTVGHNLFLLRRLNDLRVLGQPILVGPSRKSFLGAVLGGRPPSERVWATAGSVAAVAAGRGADIVRVHDVREVSEALRVAEAIRGAREGGNCFAGRAPVRGG